MEDKILIKSEVNKTVRNFLQKTPIVLFAIAAFFAIFLAIPWEDHYRYGRLTGWELVFDFGKYTNYFIVFLIGAVCLLFSIILSIIYLSLRKCELQITESTVKGKALFGKEVVLPLYMVSAYSTKKFCSVIAVATSSGLTKFALIANYKEIGEVLGKKMRELQQANEITTQKTSNNTSLDDLVKLKSLLDTGVISQEEFDAKKKQLLGL